MGLTFTSFVGFGQNTFPNNGSAGIGTTAPIEKLQVMGNIQIGDGDALSTKLMSGVYPYAGLNYAKTDGTGYLVGGTFHVNRNTGVGTHAGYYLAKNNTTTAYINNADNSEDFFH